MLQTQSDLIRIAQEHQKEHDVHNVSMHTAEHTQLPINLYVLVQYKSLDHKPPSKLHPTLKGPYQVVNYEGFIYTVRNILIVNL